jgi:branched-chain amino acid aminotransferase
MYFNSHTQLFLDGEWQIATEAHTGLYGQTLHYGYGVFEGIRSYLTPEGPRLFRADAHFKRLHASCEAIGIPFSYPIDELEAIAYELLQKNNLQNAYIRPLVFCGPNMSLSKPLSVHLLLCAWEWSAYLGNKNLRLMISSFCRPHPRSIPVEAKACGHYVNSILATSEAKGKGFDEALLLDYEGYLAEGPGANLFFGKGNHLFTPNRGAILPGITRDTLLGLARDQGLKVEEGKYLPHTLLKADYAFYCGTAAEVAGIESIDGTKLRQDWNDSYGKQLQKAYMDLVLRNTTQTILK